MLATAGDNHLGGDDFDERIVNYLVKEFKRTDKINLEKDPVAMQRVREEAEKAKKELSSAMSVNVNLPFISMDKNGGRHLDIALTREKFNELTYDLVERTAEPVRSALSAAGITPAQLGRVLLVGGSTRIPAVQAKVRQLTGKEPSKNLNPDECVALGAAALGAKLGGELVPGSEAAQMILMDVAPLALSVETVGGVANQVIEGNTTIPTRKSKIFSTAANFQTSVDIKVFQGDRKFTRDNKLLGNFRLNGIRRAMAGVPQIEVTFDIDVNGIVKVSAKDLGTGAEQAITITSTTSMSEDEIQQARREAMQYASQDEQRSELIQIWNDAQSLIARSDVLLKEHGKELDRKERSQIKSQVSVLQKLVHKTKLDTIDETQAGLIREQKEQLEALMAPRFSQFGL